jgi:outer membrane protein assembly factor BamB
MVRVSRAWLIGVPAVVLAAGGLLNAADWPNWLGPNHNQISPEKGFKTTWTEKPKVLWEKPLGAAFSSFTIVGDKLYTCGAKAGQQVLFCLNPASGDVIWELPFEKQYKDGQGGDGTRATPTVDDGRVYILGGFGLLLCVDAADGKKEIWRKQFNAKPQWGYSGSVLIEGDMAVVTAGGSDGGLAAFDKKTGKPIWKSSDDLVGYATPYPFTFNSKRYIVGFLGKGAIIVEAKTGREVWRTPWKTNYDINASAPVFHDGHLFLTSAYGTGCALFKLTPEGDDLKGEEVWRSKVIVNKFQQCILWDGALYCGDDQTLKCVDFMTGNELWKVPRMANATVILADKQLIVFSEGGKLLIAPASPKEFKPTAEAQILNKRCWTIPMLHDGKLYCRNLERAVCVDIAAAK